MKKVIKSIGMLSLLLVLLLVTFLPCNAYAKSNNQKYTMGMVKQLLDDYLEDSGSNIMYGSPEYTEYLTQQLMEESDKKLQRNPNVELILDYASIYLQEASEGTDVWDASFMNKTLADFINEYKSDENNPISNYSSIGPVKNYKPSEASTYARNWAQSYNPAYKQQSNDCTNFVSQILMAGGLMGVTPQSVGLPSGICSDTSYWYYANQNQMSTSFIRVKDFYSFYSSRVSTSDTASKSAAISKVDEGDVVLLKRVTTGARYHAIYISKKTSTKAYYCGHTNPRLDEDFNNISSSSNNFTIMKFSAYSQN